MNNRLISKVTRSPLHEGFLGTGHVASAVVDGQSYADTDPFFLLMDDRLDLPGGPPVGGPHPHAGFETVTLVLQGNGEEWQTGSLELMTAGKGIVHTEEITGRTNMRILQLWLVLPPEKRWTAPSLQQMLLEDVPTLKTAGGEIRVYSGSSQGLTSPLKNHTPFTLVDFQLERDSVVTQQLPAGYNGFVYVLEGAVWAGATLAEAGQTAWLGKAAANGESELVLETKGGKARFVLYAAQPHGVPVVGHGPFVADTQEDITRLYREYRQGEMPHLRDIPEGSKVRHRRADF